MNDRLQFALLQINLTAGAVSRNHHLIKRAVSGAAIAAETPPLLCVAPELAISGMPLGALPLQTGFLELCREHLEQLAAELKNGPALVLGCPERIEGTLTSSLFLLAEGKISRIGGRPLACSMAYGADRRTAPSDSVCSIFTYKGYTFAACPGLAPLLGAARFPQADALLCLDNEPFEAGQWAVLEQTCMNIARKNGKPLLRVNAVGGNGAFIHPGGSLAIDAGGSVRLSAQSWQQELALEDMDKLMTPVEKTGTESEPVPTDDMAAIGNALILGIRDYVRKSGFTKVLLGLSGGMDSSLVAALAAEALGPSKVTGILMPSRWSSQGSLDDSAALADNLGIKTFTVPISPLMDAYAAALEPVFQGAAADVTEENLQARIRANLLMAYSNKFGAMLLSTGNKSEAAVGYGTLYGDLAGSLAPIVDVYKTDVYRLAAWFNDMKGYRVIPQSVFDKAPSAELHQGQLDQDSLPPYDTLDTCLRCIFEGEALCERAACPGVDTDIMHNVAELVRRSEFKRHQATQGLFVSSRPLGLMLRPLPSVTAE